MLGGMAVAACGGHVDDAPVKTDKPDAGVVGDSAGPDASEGGDASTSPLTLVTEPGQGLMPIYALISSAKRTIDMTMYELTDSTVTGLLTTAVKNGVVVRVILDQNLEKTSNTTAFDALGAGGAQVHWANMTYSATHQKTVTIDATTSAIMTLNLTPEYYATSRDFAVITTDAADVAAIEKTFAADFTNGTIGPPTGDDLVWSPTNAKTTLLGLINGAKKTLQIENEEMSDASIVSALGSAASRGVAVEIVMTASREWDASFTTLVAAGAKVVTYARSASLYIHAKVVVADYGPGTGSAFVGSENFSTASLEYNRELGIVTSDPTLLASVSGTLTSDFAGGTAYP